MSSIVQTMQKRTTKNKQSLPISFNNNTQNQTPLRRRLSTISINLQTSSISTSSTASWAIQRSKSLSSLGYKTGTSVMGWWAWGWAWIMTRKPAFAQDLELNEDEKLVIGFHNRGSIMHVFYKAKSQLRKLFCSNDMSLPH